MATLVLTVAGTALAGPIGGAVGGMIGNAIDRRLFAGKGREGPRLTELAVQTSSYGTPIPQLFGTMRVAGTVIWSTDLKEARGRTGGGKGQPAATEYSYSASFAVLLSARAIRGIGRIWADGQLVRGAAGDLKVKAGLRVHPGTEDQAADPLIASAEASTPAYRGMAYLVWEDLPLAQFGNSIPQLTVEVVADDAAVPVTAIARAVAEEAGGEDDTPTLAGFAATGTVRGVLEVLAEAAGGWWAPEGARLMLRRGVDAAVTLTDAGVRAAGQRTPARARQIAPIENVPRAIAVHHYDPARDYQAGVQRAVRGGPGGGDARVEMPAAIDAGSAHRLAATLLAAAGAERVQRTLSLGFAGLTIPAGATATISGETGRWRVLETQVEGMATRLRLTPLPAAPVVAAPVDSGTVAGAPDAVAGTTLLHLAELPALDDQLATTPRLTIAATGSGAGWRQASLMWSADDGVSWTPAGATAAPATLGSVEAAPPPATAYLRDTRGAIIVRLARADMMLADADDDALDRGANLAVAGGELIQFGRAVPIDRVRWRLTRLLRGRRGTEATPMATGDPFTLLDGGSVRTLDLPLAALGRTVRILASGVGDAAPVEAQRTLEGASIRPPSPVHAERAPDGALRWIRRSRLGWTWRDGGDVPLGEEAERYRVTLIAGDGERVERDCDTPRLPGPIAAGTRIEIRQRGTFADSLPLHLML